MATASCSNGDCGHDWTLQKAPGEYKNGVRCPSCGSTDVEIHNQGGAPATQEQAGQQTQGTVQTQGQAQAGPSMTQSAIALVDDDVGTAQKAQAAQGLFGGLGGIVSEFLNFQAQKQQAAEKRAQEVTLSKSDLPTCTRELDDGSPCGYQFGPEDIGVNKDRVRCPACGSVYDLEGPA